MTVPGQGKRWRRQPWVAPGDGADHITGLPLELRARIASFLPFRQVGQLSSLSRPWRRIHDHTPVVRLELHKFLFLVDEIPGALFLDQGLAAALRRRRRLGEEEEEKGKGTKKVDTLRIFYSGFTDPRARRHADRIIELADARELRVELPNGGDASCAVAWALRLPPSARELAVLAFHHLAPAIAGPGAAALRDLRLVNVVIRGAWPCLPSLEALTLDNLVVEAPLFPPGTFPLLEDLCVSVSEIRPDRVDIRLPRLERLELDHVGPLGDVTVVAPALEVLVVNCNVGCESDYRSFTLRAPRLRGLAWHNQFAERMDMDVGSPGSVAEGVIELTWNGAFIGPSTKECRALMMRMLEGLLPELPLEQLPDAVRPYIAHDKYIVDGTDEDELVPEEKLTCDLDALMSSLQV